MRNRKIKWGIGIGTTILSIFAAYALYKVPIRNYYRDNITFGYLNENIKNKDLTSFYKLLQESGYEFDAENVKNLQRKILSIGVVKDGSITNVIKEPVILVDTGIKFPYYYYMFKKYFVPAGDKYVLKKEYVEKYNIGRFGVSELYGDFSRGNFFFSTNYQRITRVKEEKSALSSMTKKFLDNRKNEKLGILFFNLKKESMFGLNTFISSMDYTEEEKFKGMSFLFFRELKLKPPVGDMSRELKPYVGKNRMYISVPDYVKIYDLSRNYLRKNSSIDFLFGFWQSVVGVDVMRLAGDIDEEIIYDFSTGKGIVKLKSTDRASQLANFRMGSNISGLDMNLRLRDKYLYFGSGEKILPSGEEVEIKENQLLYYDQNIEGREIHLEAFNYKNFLTVKIELNREFFKNILEKHKKETKND